LLDAQRRIYTLYIIGFLYKKRATKCGYPASYPWLCSIGIEAHLQYLRAGTAEFSAALLLKKRKALPFKRNDERADGEAKSVSPPSCARAPETDADRVRAYGKPATGKENRFP
jgi:hypothetical protein